MHTLKINGGGTAIKRSDNVNHAIISAISIFILFFAAVVIIIAAVFAFNIRGDFVSALKGEIRPSLSFYVLALVVIFASSIVYTPFSYGVSNYFLNPDQSIFYFFKTPKVLAKAILLDSIKRVIIALERFVVLAVAVVGELVLIRVTLGPKTPDQFLKTAQTLSKNKLFIVLNIVAWSAVIAIFIVIKIRYILCKYALIYRPELSVLKALGMGVCAIRKNVFKTIRFYVKFASIYIFMFLTLGFCFKKSARRSSFSSYAMALVKICNDY